MRLPFRGSTFTYSIFVLSLFFVVSCSKDNEAPEPITEDYLEIPDIHFETVLVEQGIDSDGIINQQMLRSDAEKVSVLDLNLSGNFGEIRDLTGIEGFVNLTFLSAAGQELEEIDLSFNTQLDTLFLHANYLSHIDLSKNPNLVFVDIQSNQLSSITGLSEATRLKKLNVSWNNLESFTLQNGSVENLLISNNLLTSFDVQGATQLKSILLTTNQLTSVDLRSNTQLEVLVISDNQIQDLNLEQNSHLKYLYISSNALTSLDVSNNQELIDLRVDRNPDLSCIQIHTSQDIPTVSKSDHQELNSQCN